MSKLDTIADTMEQIVGAMKKEGKEFAYSIAMRTKEGDVVAIGHTGCTREFLSNYIITATIKHFEDEIDKKAVEDNNK